MVALTRESESLLRPAALAHTGRVACLRDRMRRSGRTRRFESLAAKLAATGKGEATVTPQEKWLERECPKCFTCGQRITEGIMVKFQPCCLACYGLLKQDAAKVYDELPRLSNGKISARKPTSCY